MEHWDAYWQNNSSTDSFGDSSSEFTSNPDVKSLWLPLLKSLEGNGSVIDIGCGNGSLILLIAEYCKQHNLSTALNAVDLANIDFNAVINHRPDLRSLVENISVYKNTSASDLPFEASTATHIVSQFGFEYMSIDSTLAEVSRVLKESGIFEVLVHHADSPVTKDSKRGVQILQQSFITGGLFDLASEYLSQGSNKDKLKASMNHLIEFGGESGQHWSIDVTRRLARLFQQQNLSSDKRLHLCNNIKKDFQFSFERSKSQVNAALTEKDIESLTIKAKKNGLHIESFNVFYINKNPFAWHLTFRKIGVPQYY